jgi:hypothetical protein
MREIMALSGRHERLGEGGRDEVSVIKGLFQW